MTNVNVGRMPTISGRLVMEERELGLESAPLVTNVSPLFQDRQFLCEYPLCSSSCSIQPVSAQVHLWLHSQLFDTLLPSSIAQACANRPSKDGWQIVRPFQNCHEHRHILLPSLDPSPPPPPPPSFPFPFQHMAYAPPLP